MSDTRLSERQQDILGQIASGGAQQIEELARRYGLTSQSIRRDINVLCSLGLARRLHGGVDLPVLPRNTPVNARSQLHGAAKRRIAARIAADIPDGATVFLGIGTTVQFTAAALRDHSRLTVVTNNFDVASVLGAAEGVELHVTGGLWRANDRDVVGLEAIRYFDRDVVGLEAIRYFEKFHATHAVVGAGGLHPVIGALDFTHGDAQITNAILENARIRYLAADASKWTRAAAVRVAPLSAFSHLVTDQLPDDPEILNGIQLSGLDVIACGEE
jgi:DeoR family transcriptional regulator, glycerol-3-phosphate regulon repressor